MSEISSMIPAGRIFLEASYMEGRGSASEGVILCHPHPLYGGSMDNNVISTLQDTLSRWGWGTIRFNFRGVGRSGGAYGDGEGEVEDVMAVATYLEKEKGKKILHIAGYSFGAWIALKAIARGIEAGCVILVSPPMDFLDFGLLRLPQKPCLITVGDRDSFCALGTLRAWLEQQQTNALDFQTLAGCDHFYWNQEELLSVRVSEFLGKHFHSPA